MSFNGNFTVAATTTLGSLLLTDTSSGSDAGLTGRTISIYKANGDLYTPAIAWAIGDTTKTLAILDKDYAFNIIVAWTSSAPLASPSTYSAEQLFAYTKYGWYEYSQLTRLQTSQPDTMSDRDYYFYKIQMEVELTGAEIAVSSLMEDRYASQRSIDRSQYLIQKKQLFY